jgi:hypothetical protein
MKILGREFTGPLKVEYQTLPKSAGIYIITRVYGTKIKPIYIGFTKDIKHRIHAHLIQGPIPKKNFEDPELKLFYLTLDDENNFDGELFERELIQKFEPTFNTQVFQSNNAHWSSLLDDSKVEKARKFSSIVAAVASLSAIAATLSFSTNLLFDRKDEKPNSDSLANTSLIINYPKILKRVDDSKKEIESIKSEIKSLSSKPTNANWSIESNQINHRISLIESKLAALEAALTVDPAKSLAIPLLRKDLDNTQNAFKIELAQSKAEVDRIYDQNKWFIGMMVTVAVAVLGMAINNFFAKKS